MSKVELPLAQRYVSFREEVFSGLAEDAALPGWSEPMTELHLQSLWFGGEFGSAFTSADGKAIVIRDFGTWNAGAGPDFTGCTVLIDGQSFTGDIELDPDVRDWERHGHGANMEFNRVVLHVFVSAPVEARMFTRTQEHKEVPQVQLTSAMLASSIAPPYKQAPARLGRCSTPLREMDIERVRTLIESAAQYRLQKKAARVHQCVMAHGREQALYQALAQTLGYRFNQRPFTLLAQRLPLRRMLSLEPLAREALLFGIAGFLDATPFDHTKDTTREYLRGLWQHWWKQRSEFGRWAARGFDMKWKLAATRPGNHPQRRLGALAAVLAAWNKVSAPLKHADAWNRASWCKVIETLSHEFWSKHYTLLANPAAKPIALIGSTRVQEMLANVVYPLLVPERPALWAEYLELPAMLDNQKVRRAVQRLFGESDRSKDFLQQLHHQQGLLQVYEDFCLEDDSACADCPFPERLAQWR